MSVAPGAQKRRPVGLPVVARNLSKGSATGTGLVLITLASGQFLMTLDMSVMNVAIATVAKDVGTTVSGIQMAITLYTLVMATLMITGGKIGTMIGRRRAFMIGCVIYGAGSLTTAVAPNLTTLIIGWSFLEGVGAALIMPAIVALVASNFVASERPRAYGLVAAAAAIAVAVGPLLGGFATAYFSWRWVFVVEVVIVLVLLALARRLVDPPPEARRRLDAVGSVLCAAGLGLFVFGVLRSAEWGWVHATPGSPTWFNLSPVVWLMCSGLLLTWLFVVWETRLEARGAEPLVRPSMLRSRQLTGGLLMFFFQFFVQAGVFFIIPLFLSVALGLSALQTGVRLLPLSITLLIAAVGVPKFAPRASPRRVVQIGLLLLVAGTLALIAGLEVGAGAEIVTIPLLLMGLGVGALASQLGAVTVSSVPDAQSAEVGGLQNTATNLGASLGTALVGAVLIASLSTAFVNGVEHNPAIPASVKTQVGVSVVNGVPFVSDAQLQAALDHAGVSPATADAIVTENEKDRIVGLRSALAIVALVSIGALFFTRRIPSRPAAATPDATA
jgi:EmrB/QacA subfamily drug resistance transporter